MHTSDVISILNCALDSPCFLRMGLGHDFSNVDYYFKKYSRNHTQAANPSMFDFKVARFELQSPAIDRINPGDSDGQAEMSVLSGKVVLCSNYRTLVPMSYLKLGSFKYLFKYNIKAEWLIKTYSIKDIHCRT